MIQIELGDTAIIVLEPDNVDRIKGGAFIRMPGAFQGPIRYLVIDYTPDVPWVTEQVTLLFHGKDPSDVAPRSIQKIISDSRSRPEVRNRPAHPSLNMLEKLTPQ